MTLYKTHFFRNFVIKHKLKDLTPNNYCIENENRI